MRIGYSYSQRFGQVGRQAFGGYWVEELRLVDGLPFG